MTVTTIRRPTATAGGTMTSPVVRAGDLLFTGAFVAVGDNKAVSGDLPAQMRQIPSGLQELLTGLGSTLDDVVAVVSFHNDRRLDGSLMGSGREAGLRSRRATSGP